jgi:hypothetical protein
MPSVAVRPAGEGGRTGGLWGAGATWARYARYSRIWRPVCDAQRGGRVGRGSFADGRVGARGRPGRDVHGIRASGAQTGPGTGVAATAEAAAPAQLPRPPAPRTISSSPAEPTRRPPARTAWARYARYSCIWRPDRPRDRCSGDRGGCRTGPTAPPAGPADDLLFTRATDPPAARTDSLGALCTVFVHLAPSVVAVPPGVRLLGESPLRPDAAPGRYTRRAVATGVFRWSPPPGSDG